MASSLERKVPTPRMRPSRRRSRRSRTLPRSPARWTPSAPLLAATAARSTSPGAETRTAAPASCAAGARALTRFTSVRSSAAARRSSTAATAPARHASTRRGAKASASSMTGLIRYRRAGSSGIGSVGVKAAGERKRGRLAAPFPSAAIAAKRRSGRHLLEVALPLAERCEAVHLGAVREGGLRGGDVAGLTAPGLLGRRLQGAAVRERELPREAADAVHGVEVGGRLLVRLAARQEGNARHGRGHAALQHLQRLLRDLLDGSRLARLLARHDHVGLQHRALEGHALVVELLVDLLQHPFGDLGAGGDVVRAVHEHLGLDDRHDVRLPAQGGVARERVRIGEDAGVARLSLADVDDGAPLREAGAEAVVLLEPAGEAVEALGHGLAGAERHGLGAGVDLDARDRAGLLNELHERGAVLRALAQRFVEEDDARDVALHGLRRAEQELAVVAPVVGRRLDPDGVEALLDGRRAFVGREDALAGLHHRVCDLVELVEVHRSPPASSCMLPQAPAMETSFLSRVRAAAWRAAPTVPWSNGACSKAPSGPFHTSVAASLMAALTRSTDCEPTSRIMPSEGIASTP